MQFLRIWRTTTGEQRCFKRYSHFARLCIAFADLCKQIFSRGAHGLLVLCIIMASISSYYAGESDGKTDAPTSVDVSADDSATLRPISVPSNFEYSASRDSIPHSMPCRVNQVVDDKTKKEDQTTAK